LFSDVVVQTTYGPVKGKEVAFEGTKYKAFKGIPYAAPPVGILRFAVSEKYKTAYYFHKSDKQRR